MIVAAQLSQRLRINILIVLKVSKKCAAWMKAQHLVYIFRWKMCHMKKRKIKNIEYLRHHSIDFHQNDRTVSGHITLVTDDIENLGQGQNLRKC